jgi:hypothetical protein
MTRARFAVFVRKQPKKISGRVTQTITRRWTSAQVPASNSKKILFEGNRRRVSG